MAHRLGELELNDAAKQAAGNWKRFPYFIWDRSSIPDADHWAILYTHHRDSGLLDQSNAGVIRKVMEPFTCGNDPDVVMESHSHWVVGSIEGFSLRVFRDGDITTAFRQYHELAEALDGYPILDDEDYSRREYEATIENLVSCAWRLQHEFALPADWQYDVYDWLSDNDGSAIENMDDQGGCPSEEALRTAFAALGYPSAAAVSPNL